MQSPKSESTSRKLTIYLTLKIFTIMNDSNPSARLAQKLFGLASKKYGAPYCGSPLIDDALSQGVRFWVSGIAVGGVGIPGMYVRRRKRV